MRIIEYMFIIMEKSKIYLLQNRNVPELYTCVRVRRDDHGDHDDDDDDRVHGQYVWCACKWYACGDDVSRDMEHG